MKKANQAGDGKILWKNVSGKLTLRDGRRIVAGETFEAHPDDIPQSFRDTTRPVSSEDLQEFMDPEVEAVQPVYKVVPGKGPGKYDVVDGHGKLMSKGLTLDAANQMVDDLGG